MIKQIYFNNFKCFNDCQIPLKKLNILAGENGCGKSTVIQSLLLLRQSYEKDIKLRHMIISGEYINLGNSSDIINEYTEESNIHMKLENTKSGILTIDIPYESNKNYVVSESKCSGSVSDFNIFSENFEYIAADRIIPQTIYTSINYNKNLGIHGEKIFSYLSLYGTEPVFPALCNPTISNGLIYQTDFWLNRWFKGFHFSIQEIIKADSISLRYQEKSDYNSSNEYRPINVGFGITYILPVIVALLKATPGDMVIVENPECHLHPKAQRLIGELMAIAANAGIQVIVETHSDHILNGVRISVKNQVISSEDTQVLFFDREAAGKVFHTNVYAPNILSDGSLDYWPEGFFDEWDNALTELL